MHYMKATFVAAALFGLVGCGDTPTEVIYPVIEETEFAASLNVDLSGMQRTGLGVYFEDLVAGGGDEVVFGTSPTVTYTLWLADGTEVDSGTINFMMGSGQVIRGFEDGLLNQRVGGTRLVIIPPQAGYASQTQFATDGSVSIPGGSILVYRQTVDEVN